MSYKTEDLKAYAALDIKKKERLNAIRAEVEKIEQDIAVKQEKYTEALRNDEEETALNLLEEIQKLSNEVRFKSDKAAMLGNGEQTVKNERAAAAMVEYKGNLKHYEKSVADIEAELKEIEKQYIAKVHKIVDLSTEFQQLHFNYSSIPSEVGDKQNRAMMFRNHNINPNKYSIENLVKTHGGK